MAVYALTEYVRADRELSPDYTVMVDFDGWRAEREARGDVNDRVLVALKLNAAIWRLSLPFLRSRRHIQPHRDGEPAHCVRCVGHRADRQCPARPGRYRL